MRMRETIEHGIENDCIAIGADCNTYVLARPDSLLVMRARTRRNNILISNSVNQQNFNNN